MRKQPIEWEYILDICKTKTYTIDISSREDVTRHINKLKAILGNINFEENGVSKKDKKLKRLELAEKLWNTDISQIYNDINLDKSKKYYVYMHLDPCKKVEINGHHLSAFSGIYFKLPYLPFYVGKGIGDRYMKSDRNASYGKVRKRIEELNRKVEKIIILNNLTEKEALIYESKLIDLYGIIQYGGMLSNLDEGYRCEERRKLYPKECYEIMSGWHKHKYMKNIVDI